MERVLEKIAKQLGAYDEASLMDLWTKYAEEVTTFTPSKRWEEAALVFCLIQAVHWKNQLFNYHMALEKSDLPFAPLPNLAVPAFMQREKIPTEEQPKKASVLKFPDPE